MQKNSFKSSLNNSKLLLFTVKVAKQQIEFFALDIEQALKIIKRYNRSAYKLNDFKFI